ncbi:sulfur carrier protein ThiS [Carnimonas nigrificans]|uniref:sulfur carrier protein ThiS n=1 Tax=Carnimonas nigrificans TaxID=64323 RepID=UPI000472F8BA|nr:sulfur carrier protein ThiS [Carnimonas nigrificans]
MQLYLNGEAQEFNVTTVAELVASLQLTGKRIAVERNEQIVPRSRHAETALEEFDRIEIVHAIGGG